MTPKDDHIDEEIILGLMIEAFPLTAADKLHLENCPDCQSRISKLQSSLDRLSLMASHFSPTPKRSLNHQVVKKRTLVNRGRYGVVLCFCLLVIGLFPVLGPEQTTDQIFQQDFSPWIEADAEFYGEIQLISENALPPVYLMIQGEEEVAY